MDGELSPRAKKIIEAGIEAGMARDPNALIAADRAVERATGQVGLDDPLNGEVRIIDSLLEIAQLHVRSRLTAPNI